MSWVTVIWSMIASACLTLAAIYCLVWYRNRTAWAHLFFSVTAASTVVFAFCELWMMRAETPGELQRALVWAELPFLFWLVSITWFVRFYLDAGRPWLAWTCCGWGLFYLLVSLAVRHSSYREVTSLRHVPFLGESVTVLGAAPHPWMLFGQSAMWLVLAFVADASVTAWRRGDRRKALMVGGSVGFLLVASLGTPALVLWADIPVPIVFSWLYLGLVAVMGYELSGEVLRASQLARGLQASEAQLRESEARMSLAVDAADFGIWIRHLARHEIWASDKWRELCGFAPSQALDFDLVLHRLHPDDRVSLQRAHDMAIAGSNDGHYQVEVRLILPDGTIRWIASQGHVEWDAGQAVLIRSGSRDVTAHKRAELAVRNLSGRLLSAQEEERRRIARELHDHLSQRMAVLSIGIGQVAKRLESSPATAAQGLRDLGQLIVEITTDIHNLSHRLHSTKLETLGLTEALRGHCQELLSQGVDVRFDHENVPPGLPLDVTVGLFRIVQEALTNVVKHSRACEAHVTLRATGEVLVLTILDRGRGFDEGGAALYRGGLGLASMRERLRLLDGEFTLRSQPGQGTTIVARVPIPVFRSTPAADIVGAAG